MKHLVIILVLSWVIVSAFAVVCFSVPIYSWWWVIALMVAFLYLVILCIGSGITGVAKYNALMMPAIVNGVCGFFSGTILAAMHGGLPTPLIGVGAFLFTLIPAVIMYVFTAKTQPVQKAAIEISSQPAPEVDSTPLPPIPKPLKYFLMTVIIILLIVLGGWCSKHNFIIPEEIYWKKVTAHVGHLTPKHFSERQGYPKNLLFDESGNLYTGVVEAYKPQLRINPFLPEPKGVEYYVNGKCWGISNEDHKVVHPLRMYMSDIVPQESKPAQFIYEKYLKNIRSKIEEESEGRYLIHKDYIENVSHKLEEYMDGYVITSGEYPSIYLLGTKYGRFRRLRIQYHDENGLVKSIGHLDQLGFDSQRDWDSHPDFIIRFDRLGKISNESKWKREDFVFIDSFPDPVLAGVATAAQKEFLKEKLLSTGRIFYGNETFRWNRNYGLLKNLYQLISSNSESIPDGNIYTGVTYTGGSRLKGADRELFLDILSRCNDFTINDDFTNFFLERGHSYLATWFEFANSRVDISLYYVDGRFLLGNSFYSFPVDDPADRKQLERLFIKYNVKQIKE